MTTSLNPQTVFAILNKQTVPVIYCIPVYKETITGREIIEFKVAYSNKVADADYGITQENVVVKQKEDLDNKEATLILHFGLIKQVYETGNTAEESTYYPDINSNIQLQYSKVENGVLTIIHNSSKDKQLLVSSTEEQTLTNSILDASLDSIMALEAVYDDKGRVTDFLFTKVNKALTNKLRVSESDLIGKKYLTISPNSNEYGLFELKCNVLESKVPIQTEVYYKGLGIDGWYNISIVPLGNNGVLETFTDISDNKRDKLNLEKTALKLETVINTSKAGMFTLIAVKNELEEVVDFRFGIVNQAVASYIGQTAEVLKGSLGSIYFPAYKENGLFELYKDNYLNGTNHNFDFHYEDGYDVFFNIDIVKMGDEVLVTFTDHTHLKRLQRELELKIKELGRSNANLEEFAHAASHDLKEPLRKIRIFADRLKQSLQTRMDPIESGLFDRMDVSTERMQQLVDDLLEFSHVSQDPHRKEKVNLNERIEKVIADLELLIEEKQAKIFYNGLPEINGYKRQLEQLFLNLLSNALKYSKSDINPEIYIESTEIKGSEVAVSLPETQSNTVFYLISIKDNGIGFDQQYAERIFDMFQRLHGKSEYSGTGIGLSIARKVVENHNGYIWATSQVNEGAKFNILLPL